MGHQQKLEAQKLLEVCRSQSYISKVAACSFVGSSYVSTLRLIIICACLCTSAEAQKLEAQKLEAQRLEVQKLEAQRLEVQRLEAQKLEEQKRVEEDRS